MVPTSAAAAGIFHSIENRNHPATNQTVTVSRAPNPDDQRHNRSANLENLIKSTHTLSLPNFYAAAGSFNEITLLT